jgi:hypothetical protein
MEPKLPESLLPRGFRLADVRIERARVRARSTESLVKKLFGLAKSEADVEKQLMREATKKVIEEAYRALDTLRGFGPYVQEILPKLESDVEAYEMDLNSELEEELQETDDVVGEVGRICIVLMDREIRQILRFLLVSVGKVEASDKLHELKAQYQNELSIDVEAAPVPWGNSDGSGLSVVEIHEARNCIVHSDSVIDEKFREKVRYPVLAGGNKIVVDREKLDDCVRVFSEFTSFVIESVDEAKRLEKS